MAKQETNLKIVLHPMPPLPFASPSFPSQAFAAVSAPAILTSSLNYPKQNTRTTRNSVQTGAVRQ